MNGREAVRVGLLAVIFVCGTVLLVAWPEAAADPEKKPEPRTRTVVVTKTVIPEECHTFVADADAFVDVTGDFLAVQNRAIDAVLDVNADRLKNVTRRLTRLQGRYDMVIDAYADSRSGCL